MFISKSRGFSLTEILLSMALIGMVLAVAVPNLQKFNTGEEINGAASQLINVLNTARSSAVSHIRCPSGRVSNNWNVVLNTATYALNANCPTSGDEPVKTGSYTPAGNPAATFNMSSDRCSPDSLLFTFTNNQLAYRCGADPPGTSRISWPVRITLSRGSLTKVVVVEAGGIVRPE